MSGWDLIHHIGPSIAMFVGAGLVLTADVIIPRGRGTLVPLTLLSLVVAAGWALWHANAGTSGTARPMRPP